MLLLFHSFFILKFPLWFIEADWEFWSRGLFLSVENFMMHVTIILFYSPLSSYIINVLKRSLGAGISGCFDINIQHPLKSIQYPSPQCCNIICGWRYLKKFKQRFYFRWSYSRSLKALFNFKTWLSCSHVYLNQLTWNGATNFSFEYDRKWCADSSCPNVSYNGCDESTDRKLLPSVSTALVLALTIGILEALAMYFGSGLFLDIMGISSVSWTQFITLVVLRQLHSSLILLLFVLTDHISDIITRHRSQFCYLPNLYFHCEFIYSFFLYASISIYRGQLYLKIIFWTGIIYAHSSTEVSVFESNWCSCSSSFSGHSGHLPWI